MLESDEKLAYSFFGFGLALALAAMVLGPLNISNWSIAAGVTASFVALIGMYFAFQSWNEPDSPQEQEKRELSAEDAVPPADTEPQDAEKQETEG